MLIQSSIRVGLLKLNTKCLELRWTKDILQEGMFYFWHVLTCQCVVIVAAIAVLKFSAQNEPPLLFTLGTDYPKLCHYCAKLYIINSNM